MIVADAEIFFSIQQRLRMGFAMPAPTEWRNGMRLAKSGRNITRTRRLAKVGKEPETMNRRDFLKAGAIGATAGPSLAKEAMGQMAAGSLPSAAGYGFNACNPNTNPMTVAWPPDGVSKLYEQIQSVQSVVNCDGVTDRMELDLLTMKSTSLAWKVSVTRKREAERRTIVGELMEQIRKLQGG